MGDSYFLPLKLLKAWHEIYKRTRGVSDVGFPIFSDTDADFAF